MLSICGQRACACDGVSRREWLRIGGLSALGFALPRLLQNQARAQLLATGAAPENLRPSLPPTFGNAQACILVFLFGGPSHIDLWDMKPEAPDDFRGEFRPIATSVPGVQICEHFSRLARQMHLLTVVRSMHHGHPRHGYGLHYMFTGREHPRPDLDAAPEPTDFPSLGAMVSKFVPNRQDFPPAITLPRWNRFLDLPNTYAGESAGFLGKSFEPWLLEAHAESGVYQAGGVASAESIPLARVSSRALLWTQLGDRLARMADSAVVRQHSELYHQAFTLISSPQAQLAFRLEQEPEQVRANYGNTPMGNGLLLARRLIEAGTRLVTVNWHNDGSDVKSPFWDTHKDNFNTLKNRLVPPVDQGLTALLQDLQERGLLDSTLVLVMGEFGRTPRIGRVVMNAATDASGRDHWPHAYSILMAGGGIKRGYVHGASDNRAAHVADSGMTPPDLTATVLHLLGVDPTSLIFDLQGRAHHLSDGQVATGLFA